MKKLFLVVALATFTCVTAQKNTLLVGGNVGISSAKTSVEGGEDIKTNVFVFSPTIGYQFNDNWTAGVNASIGSSKDENVESDDFFDLDIIEKKVNTFKVGPFVRYTKALGDSGLFSVYGDLGGGLISQKDERTFDTGFGATTSTIDSNGFYVGFTPALFLNFKNSFGLNFSIGGIEYQSIEDTDIFNFNFGQTVNIGISKNFNL